MIGYIHRASENPAKFLYYRKGDTASTLDWTTNQSGLVSQIGPFTFITTGVPFSQNYWIKPNSASNSNYLQLDYRWFRDNCSNQGSIELVIEGDMGITSVQELVSFGDNIIGTRFFEHNMYVGGGQQNVFVINGTQTLVAGTRTSPMYVLVTWYKKPDGNSLVKSKWYSISGTTLTLNSTHSITNNYPPFHLFNQNTDSTLFTSFNGLALYPNSMSMIKISNKYTETPSRNLDFPSVGA